MAEQAAAGDSLKRQQWANGKDNKRRTDFYLNQKAGDILKDTGSYTASDISAANKILNSDYDLYQITMLVCSMNSTIGGKIDSDQADTITEVEMHYTVKTDIWPIVSIKLGA